MNDLTDEQIEECARAFEAASAAHPIDPRRLCSLCRELTREILNGIDGHHNTAGVRAVLSRAASLRSLRPPAAGQPTDAPCSCDVPVDVAGPCPAHQPGVGVSPSPATADGVEALIAEVAADVNDNSNSVSFVRMDKLRSVLSRLLASAAGGQP